MEHVKGLRHPIRASLNGHPVTLMTIGHVAHAVGRSVWTVRHWERIGLLPRTPFVINKQNPTTRRRLFPQPFVEQLAEIVADLEIHGRLDHELQQRFRTAVFAAFEETVAPLLVERGVTGDAVSFGEEEGGQGQGRSSDRVRS